MSSKPSLLCFHCSRLYVSPALLAHSLAQERNRALAGLSRDLASLLLMHVACPRASHCHNFLGRSSRDSYLAVCSVFSARTSCQSAEVWRRPSAGLKRSAHDLARLWRRYVRSHLLSSDYEGCVTLWDVDTGLAVNEYEAHDKRIWSVDSCTADSSLFVSGSDDGWIKVVHSCSTRPCLSLFGMHSWHAWCHAAAGQLAAKPHASL